MTIETKYSIGQTVFTLLKSIGKIHSDRIVNIWVERWVEPDGRELQICKYKLYDGAGPLQEDEVFPSRQELLNSL